MVVHGRDHDLYEGCNLDGITSAIDDKHRLDEYRKLKSGHQDGPISGMESVITTVTGYAGDDRARLIKLINGIGGAYVGSLSRSTTHLVCWMFQGTKYELAKKLGTLVVNHRWFEDCLKAGKRLPESPYTVLSGKAVGPLRWKEVFDLPILDSNGVTSCDFKEHIPAELKAYSPKLVNNRSNCLLLPDSDQQNHFIKQVQGKNCELFDENVRGKESAKNCQRRVQQDLNCSQDKVFNSCLEHVVDKRRGDINCKIAELPVCASYSHQKNNRDTAVVSLNSKRFEEERSFNDNEKETGSTSAAPILQHKSKLNNPGDYSCLGRNQFSERALRAEENRNKVVPLVYREKSEENVNQRKRPQQSSQKITKERTGKLRRLMKKSVPCSILNFVCVQNDDSSEKPVLEADTQSPQSSLQSKNGSIHNQDVSSPLRALDGQSCNSVMGHSGTNTMLITAPVDIEIGAPMSPLPTCVISSNTRDKEKLQKSPKFEIACVICHSETISPAEGILDCGHHFCFDCIHHWASELVSKSPTCPLCKAPFDTIMKRERPSKLEDAENYSESSMFEENVVLVGGHHFVMNSDSIESTTNDLACIMCGSRDTEELLLKCNGCSKRSAHTFCLDPPLPPFPGTPWFCGRCTQRRRSDTRWWYLLHGAELS